MLRATVKVALTMIGPMALGSMCLTMMRRFVAPSALAASTKSRSRSTRKSARTSRATYVHDSAPMMIARPSQLLDSLASLLASTISTARIGTTSTRSTKRMSSESTQPR